jgi:cellulose synthase/poly-beta-1,6-N-acetylglucosamine synthase-like glycosyltransferase
LLNQHKPNAIELLSLNGMLTTIIFAISITLFTSYAVLILYYKYCWQKINNFDVSTKAFTPCTPISIVIPARNEAANIVQCLNAICKNDYPTELFEIIVVDDHSTDETASLVKNYPEKNITLLHLQDFIDTPTMAYKKKALETAITYAKGNLILTTDADCIAPAHWLQTIDAFYQQTDAALIVMPVKFTANNSFLGIFQSLDFMTLQGITGASVDNKMHSMCNGANLAYTKKVFNQVNGFAGIDAIASGDDMLLMHKIHQLYPHKIHYLKSPAVIVETPATSTIKAFFNQRIRWASKADKYDDKRIFAVLLLVYLLNIWLVALAGLTIFYTSYWKITLLLLASKTIIELLFLFPVAAFFDNRKLLFWFPLAQPFHIVYTVIAGWLGKFGTYQWKGRSVK